MIHPSLFEEQVAAAESMRQLRQRQLKALNESRLAIAEGHKHHVLQAHTGWGKCHGVGTEVVMYDGFLRKVEDVRPGELLMGPDSAPRTVLNTVHGYGPLYCVTPAKGDPFVCNDAHVLSLKSTRYWQQNGAGGKGKWKGETVVNIPVSEYLDKSARFKHLHKLWRVGVDFQESPLSERPIDPYFLGVLLGDGSMVTSIGVTTMDEEIVAEVNAQATKYGLNVRKADQEDNQSSTYFFSGKGKDCPLRRGLWWLNLHGKKCGDKFIPQSYLTASREDRLQLLAGLIDTDGHVFSNHLSIEFANKSLRLIEGFEFLVRSLGFGCGRCSSVVNGVTYYRVHIHGDYSVIPTRIARKRVTKPRLQKKDVLMTGFSVEFIGNGDYYGFALDADHLYLLRDFTVTHNTLWAAHVIASALRKGKRPLFTCPSVSLVDQTLAAFEAEGIRDIGVMQAQHHRTDRNATVQIACLHTLRRRPPVDVDLVIVDEVHELTDFTAEMLAGPWKDKVVIGLSATPWTRGMGLYWTKLIVGGTIQDAFVDGFARKFPIYGPPHDIDREGIKVTAGEFEESAAASAMSEATIVGDVLKEWKEKSTYEKTFAFCVNRVHARKQMEAFQDSGIPFGYIDANTPPGVKDNELGTRKHIFAQMRHGEIAGIASVGCLIRGVDEVVYNILDLQPTKSEIRHVQKWGRMRTGDPNATYIGFDHAGNNGVQGLGMFWDIFHDTLDSRKPGERKEAYEDEPKPAKPRKCKKCGLLLAGNLRACPSCHTPIEVHSGVVVKEGRLVEYSAPKPLAVNKEHQRIFSELYAIGREAGYKMNWAALTFREMTGVKPDGLKMRGSSKRSDDVKEFVAAKRREWRKQKNAAIDKVLERTSTPKAADIEPYYGEF